jgi:hypothetical protein
MRHLQGGCAASRAGPPGIFGSMPEPIGTELVYRSTLKFIGGIQWRRTNTIRLPNITTMRPNLIAQQPNSMEKAITPRAESTQLLPSSTPSLLVSRASKLIPRVSSKSKRWGSPAPVGLPHFQLVDGSARAEATSDEKYPFARSSSWTATNDAVRDAGPQARYRRGACSTNCAAGGHS